MRSDEGLVRERAYLLWEQAGRPEGRSIEFWFAAIHDLDEAEGSAAPSQQVVEQGVLDEAPEKLAFRSAESPPSD